MQWSCPHCGTRLGVGDDILGTGWSFSRCYKCGGFALVRRAEVNIIKVDKAPPGEKVILPEAPMESGENFMSAEAIQNAAKYAQKRVASQQAAQQAATASPPLPAPLPAIPHPKSALDTKPVPPVFHGGAGAIAGARPAMIQQPENLNAFNAAFSSALPDPLPAEPRKSRKSYIIPAGISTTAVIAIISGFYLYFQTQALWSKARESAVRPAMMQPSEEQAKAVVPPPAILQASAPAENVVLAQQTVAQNTMHTEITDQVKKSAMAPDKPEIKSTHEIAKEVLAREVAAKEPVAAAVVTSNGTTPEAHPAFLIQIIVRNANLHSGPGMQFPVIGKAASAGKYKVSDWNNRWFKLQIQNPEAINSTDTRGYAWIRNDLVQILPRQSTAN